MRTRYRNEALYSYNRPVVIRRKAAPRSRAMQNVRFTARQLRLFAKPAEKSS